MGMSMTNKHILKDGLSGEYTSIQRLYIYLTNVKTLHLNCLPFVYKMMQASKASESISE